MTKQVRSQWDACCGIDLAMAFRSQAWPWPSEVRPAVALTWPESEEAIWVFARQFAKEQYNPCLQLTSPPRHVWMLESLCSKAGISLKPSHLNG